jgi:hypothetical protein
VSVLLCFGLEHRSAVGRVEEARCRLHWRSCSVVVLTFVFLNGTWEFKTKNQVCMDGTQVRKIELKIDYLD